MPKKTYTIVITEVEHDVPYTERQWKQLVAVPDEKHEEIYGYVTTPVTKDVETKIFEQTLDEIDLSNIVLTINKIGENK